MLSGQNDDHSRHILHTSSVKFPEHITDKSRAFSRSVKPMKSLKVLPDAVAISDLDWPVDFRDVFTDLQKASPSVRGQRIEMSHIFRLVGSSTQGNKEHAVPGKTELFVYTWGYRVSPVSIPMKCKPSLISFVSNVISIFKGVKIGSSIDAGGSLSAVVSASVLTSFNVRVVGAESVETRTPRGRGMCSSSAGGFSMKGLMRWRSKWY